MSFMKRLRLITAAVGLLTVCTSVGLWGQDAPSLPEGWTGQVRWRSIGPANMSGRITAIAVYEKDPYVWWAATASGGLIKTTNNGMTFVHQFDDQPTVSIGDVQVSQSDANIVWVGTGEANPRNSVSWGDGVYKSTDGGKTWKNMGLRRSFQIGRISIHPTDPNIVYVGALGRLWGPNEERGLYKTTDGGNTWQRVLFVNDQTGVIDVQMNPQNPDELIVATYERLRDGFDGNDPVKKYGPGSAIYRTRDGGQSFEKLSQGLPTVNLGRVGLEYYRADPKFIYAIIETEKIGQQPTEVPFLGITGEDAEVGAKITDVTRNASAATAGIQSGDIVLMVDDQLVTKYEQLIQMTRDRAIGDVTKWKIIRNREPQDIEITLAARPQGAGGRNPFTGTLGGQAENVQDQQGPKGFEYGGIYRSADGGDSWERINSLNPRPMYYSQIRVDPTDNSRMYCLGTSLYRSFDGGATFRADGVTSGIHVDFHALWIDPQDTRHMIIGNDGGVYVTHDRMASWDHLSHIAIGQFYHVGVDTRRNYRVYGGLQDNGSWGGPNRVGNGNGPVNTDWFSVGGGDGFITLADPDDPDQIYYESQNGGMGRLNLRTGERGGIRPQQQRGVSYRFDWKTPFILSPHNSRIFYSAGNYVFRSYTKGDAMQAISPEITNTNKGAGSALAESPLQAGVIYVGTNDGAVWVTRDGGQNWTPIFVKKETPEEKPAEATGAPTESGQPSEPAAEEKPTTPPTATPTGDPLSGQWTARATGEQARPGLGNFEADFTLKDDGSVEGKLINRRGEIAIDDGTFARDSGELTFSAVGPRGVSQYKAVLKDGVLEGTITLPDGQTTITFRAEKKPPAALPNADVLVRAFHETMSLTQVVTWTQDPVDPLAGTWTGSAENEIFPGGKIEFELVFTKSSSGDYSGSISSVMGTLQLSEVKYSATDKKITALATSDDFNLTMTATIDGERLKGDFVGDDDGPVVEFSAERKPAAIVPPVDENENQPPPRRGAQQAPPREGGERGGRAPQRGRRGGSQAAPVQETNPSTPSTTDIVSGTWNGKFVSEQLPEDRASFVLNLKLEADQTVTGTFESSRGQSEISNGKFDATERTLTFSVETGRFTISADGKIDGDQLTGTAEMAGGQFTMPFEAKRATTSITPTVPATPPADAPPSEPAAGGGQDEPAGEEGESTPNRRERGRKLEELVPGPRWVSALEASRFRAGRCYMTLDGHRSDDDEPYVFVTEDYGQTWRSIRANLPTSAGSTRVIREDLTNENVLYLGCEFSFWVSIDRGRSWTRFEGIPVVAVHEVAQHISSGEIIVATHGRSIWIADVSALRQLTANDIKEAVMLYKPNDVVRWRFEARQADSGTRRFVGQNPPNTASIFYSLGEAAESLELTISDIRGNVLLSVTDLPKTVGFHRYDWNQRRTVGGQGPAGRGGGPPGEGEPGAQRGGGRGGFAGMQVPLGTYLVTLNVDGKVAKQELSIIGDPRGPFPAFLNPPIEENLETIEQFLEDDTDSLFETDRLLD